ncbi:hypothetical protein LMG26854_02505 [Achromobacter aegrifaciens]|nr:hypothetical protein LMG26854_02505 [Achromobacter aegrifaciens]
MLKPSKAHAWCIAAARQVRKALCVALSSLLLFQGCAAPLAGEHRKPLPDAEGRAASASIAVQDRARAMDPSAAAASAPIPGGMDPAPDLEGRPLPANPNQMASADARSTASGKAIGAAQQAAESWLRQFGTARLDLLGSFHGGALDMLFPLRDSGTSLIFSQFGARRTNLLQESYRTTVNLGLGYRHFGDGYMAGVNTFLDQDVSRGHRRLGLGGEWWADYLKLSVNGYFRLSDWKRSPDARDYQERPASGWDIRTEGYLPQYPQLGGKLMFEKYYGDEVGLFGASNRQRNPSAWTLGVSYTPAPLVTLGLDHRMGQGGQSDTSFKLGLKYALGVPLAKQLQPGEVARSRKLAGMRMDLVERNNEIVLEYKKNDPMTIQLPAAASGYPRTALSFPVTLTGADAAPRIEWSGSAAPFAMPYSGGASASLMLPDYRSGGINSYQLMASAMDVHGRKIRSNVMTVSVNPLSVSVARSKAAAMADGVDNVRFTAQVRGVQAEPMGGRTVTWVLQGAGTIRESSDRTDADGVAYALVSSTVSGTIGVEAMEAQGFKGRSEAEFLEAPGTASVALLVAQPASILANGRDKTVLKATVKDGKGNAVGAGVAVNWTATGGRLSSNSSNTDASGIAVAELLSATVPGLAAITARAGAEDPGKTGSVAFLLDASDAQVLRLTPSKTTALADGLDTVTFTATVADGRGNPVGAGVAVNWGASLGTLGAASSNTDASSQATVVLTAPTAAGAATVTARAASGDPGKTAAVAFVADVANARVVQLTPSQARGTANGADAVVFTAMVEDGRGNPVGAGVTVNWSASLGTLAATSVTNASGQASALLIAPIVPGTATVTARAADGDAGKTASAVFAADELRARVAALSPSKTTGLANGTDTVTLTATIDDGRGNPLGAGIVVNWSADRGSIGASSITNASSQATVVLTAPTATGAATVTAKCAPARQAKSAGGDPGKTAAVDFIADASSAHVMELAASKTDAVANGADTVTLRAVVVDKQGNRVGAGVTVNWSTSLGQLPAATTTDSKSETSAVLIAPTSTGVATVTAKAAGGDAGQVVSITFMADASTARVATVAASKTSGLADGTDTVTFTATVADAKGNPVGAGVPVNWGASLGTLAATVSKTDANSQASAVLTAPTAVGTSTVNARAAGGDAGQTATIAFTADASSARVVSWAFSSNSSPVRANGVDAIILRAHVKDAMGNRVAGATVDWTTSLGSLASATSVSDVTGEALVKLVSTTAGEVVATAKAGAADPGKILRVGPFVADPATARVVVLTQNKTNGVADGADTVRFTATVQDAHGNAMMRWDVNGTPRPLDIPVNWTTSGGRLAATASSTDETGKATMVLTAPKVAGSVNVTAMAPGRDAGRTASVTFAAATPSTRVGSASASKASIVANARDTVIFTAVVLDGNGNSGGAGHVVNWSTDLGTLEASSTRTNAKGEATVVLTAGKLAGQATVTAKTGADDSGRAFRVALTADPITARVASLASSKTSARADGQEKLILKATVKDANGNLEVAGVTVNWRTNLGTLASATSSTDSNGVATMELRAPGAPGIAVLTARAIAADGGKTVRVEFISSSTIPPRPWQ